MELSQVFSALIGACFGALGWLFVGLYINRRTAVVAARSATRAVFFELELNRANVELAETYGELLPLSRSAYEQLLPQLANLLSARDLSTVAAAYMSHIGYEQLRLPHDHPEEARRAALSGARDHSIFEKYFTEDAVDLYPQSGELIRGPANRRWIIENYPGSASQAPRIDQGSLETRPSDGFRVVAPTYVVVHVEGGGLRGTLTLRTTYPDQSVWWVIILYELRGERICKSTSFFAPEFPAPEWRAGHVERIPGR
jgi:hypothetical protein